MVQEGDQYGYINDSGQAVIKPQFADARPFSEGLAAASVQASDDFFPIWGFIDVSGAWRIKPQFAHAGEFHEGLAVVQIEDQYKHIALVSKDGLVVSVPISADDATTSILRDVSEGLAAFSRNGSDFGFLDSKGGIRIAPKYASVGDFHGGLAWACLTKCGFINTEGKEVIPFIYVSALDFKDGRAPVCDDRFCGLIDRDGLFLPDLHVFLVTQQWGAREIVELNESRRHLYISQGLFGYLDEFGQSTIRPQFVGAREFSEGAAVVTYNQEGTCSYIDRDGNRLVPAVFDSCDDFHDGLAAVGRSNPLEASTDWEYINERGDIIWPSREQ